MSKQDFFLRTYDELSRYEFEGVDQALHQLVLATGGLLIACGGLLLLHSYSL